MCEIYRKARDALRSAKVKLRKLALKESREQFLNTIDTKEINDQLDDSLYDADRGAGCQKRWCTIRKNEDTLPNFYLTSLREPTEEVRLDRRIRMTKAMVAFCRVRETSSQK
jgi:hypothetical protein